MIGGHHFYRQDVLSNGAAKFRCIVRGCRARLGAKYKNKRESTKDVEPAITKIHNEHNHEVTHVNLLVRRFKDAIKTQLETDTTITRTKVLFDNTVAEYLLILMDDEDTKKEFLNKIPYYDTFCRTMARWRNDAKIRTEVNVAVNQPHDEWRPDVDAIKIEYTDDLVQDDASWQYEHGVDPTTDDSIIAEPKVEIRSAEDEAEMKDNLWRARYIMERKKDGKMIPHYIIDDIKYHRNNVQHNGVARFKCSEAGCYISFYAKYTTREEAFTTEIEPKLTKLPLPRQHKHKADHVAMLVRQTKKAISYRCL
jgi:hypothetical protein